MIADAAGSLTANTFAIGFGQAASISTAALNAITQGHGGYLVVTGPITLAETFALTEYFLKVQAGINNSAAVLDPRGELVEGVTHRIPFTLTDADMGVDAIILSPAPQAIDFRLETPDGEIITPDMAGIEPAIQFVGTPRVSYYRASLPMLGADVAGSHAGRWYAVLSLIERPRIAEDRSIAETRGASLPYSLLVHAYSNLHFRASVLQNSHEPGAPVRVLVSLDQYDVPLEEGVQAWAEVEGPDRSRTILLMKESAAGRFEASFLASITGVYTLRVRVLGTTLEGQSFQREQKFTATVFPGGDQPPTVRDDRLCRLLSCLLDDNVFSMSLADGLARTGVNLNALAECITRYCQEAQPGFGGEESFVPGEGS
jgi:hypothetical protein